MQPCIKIRECTLVATGYPLTAFKRSNGEYLISVEEDACAKVIMYRWHPK